MSLSYVQTGNCCPGISLMLLVAVGGLIGFAKSGSSKSLMAGGGSASILYYVYLNLPSNPVMASAIGLGKCSAKWT